jgi:hypothetical protein
LKVSNARSKDFLPQPAELVASREWFAEFDAAAWDRQLEADVKAGKLEALGDRARKAHAAGTSSKL